MEHTRSAAEDGLASAAASYPGELIFVARKVES